MDKAILQILVVDDDYKIRLGLEEIITSHFSDREVSVFSCENGLIASQILARDAVDLLITDIKMPLCSGIELLTIVNENHYSCRSIILSGYDDFNLVRDALRLGASDYLLKPVDENLLIYAIEEIKNTIQISRPTHADSTSPYIVLKIQQLLEAFLSADGLSSDNVQKYMKERGLSSHTACTLCYVDIRRALYSKHLLLFQFLAEKVAECLSTIPVYTVYGGQNSFWVLLILSPDPKETPAELLAPFLNILEDSHLKYSYTKQWFPCGDLARMKAICKTGFEKYYFDLPYKTPNDTNPDATLSESLRLAAAAVSEYDYSVAIRHLEHCFMLYNFLRPPISEIKKQLNRFVYSILTQNSTFIPIISACKFTDYDILGQIEAAECLSVLQKNLYLSINHLIEKLLHSMENKEDYVIQKAKEYIDHNYHDNLTLDDVAAHVFLNSNYFSTLFRQKTGDTFRNYLRDFRIEKAKSILSNTNLRIYEVGLMVGYSEQSHFVRAFKNVTGVTPSDYRNQI